MGSHTPIILDFLYGVVALLAFVVLILTALTAWMYVQQSRIMQAISALTAAISAPPPAFFESAKEFPIEEHYEPAETVKEEVVDDRVSVHEEDDHEDEESEEHEQEQEQEHEDDLGGKTVAQLREMLTAKGIPFNKSDKKPILLNLLKVAS